MINEINRIIDKQYKKKFIILILTLLIGILLEMISIGMILPVLATIIDPENSVRIIENFSLDLSFFKISENNVIFITLVLLVSIFIVKNVTLYFLQKFQAKNYAKFNENLQNTLFTKYINQSITYLTQINTAFINRNVIELSTHFTYQFINALTISFIESIFLLGILIILIIANPFITIVGFLCVLFFAFLIFLINKRILLSAGELNKIHVGKRIKYLQEAFGGILEVKSFKKENYFIENFSKQNKIINNLQVKLGIIQFTPRLFLETISVILLSFLYVYAVIRILPSLNRILISIQRARYSLPVLNEIYFVINSLKKPVDYNEKKLIFENNIEIKNISYEYDETKKILDKANLEIKKNSLVGVIGQSGSGKSTILKIFLGLLKPSEGEILVDKNSIYDFLNSWQNKISFVPQDVYILDDNIKKNIALGIDENQIDSEKLKYAIKFSNLEKFIENLPEGTNTILGEKGSRISGGQRQRIGIARALYNQPEILVLDEATSSLDEKNEFEIFEELNSLKKKLTIVFATHRKTLRKYCDSLFEIENKKFNKINFK